MSNVFKCTLTTESSSESWIGRIIKIINHGSHHEIKIESRSGITVIVGSTEQGNFACIPDWNAGCHLSNLKDKFWNEERLSSILGEVDGITVAAALYMVADYINN